MIEAYCKYDKEMDLLVKDVVKYTLNKYGKQLNISTLKEVEVRNVQEFECPIDGRVVDKTKIVLTSRLFELLPSYELAEQCQKILNTEYSDKLDELYRLGGTSGGARPKIMTTIDEEE